MRVLFCKFCGISSPHQTRVGLPRNIHEQITAPPADSRTALSSNWTFGSFSEHANPATIGTVVPGI
jgi:hypothetical protein